MLDGSTIRLLRPDAQSTRGLLRKVLQIRSGRGRKLLPKGFTLLNVNSESLLKHLPNSLLCYPARRGHSLVETKFGRRHPALIVGGDGGKALEVVKASEAVPIRLGRWPLPPNHEIVLFNIRLDRMGMINGDSSDRHGTAR